jgi:hypothetical protein
MSFICYLRGSHPTDLLRPNRKCFRLGERANRVRPIPKIEGEYPSRLTHQLYNVITCDNSHSLISRLRHCVLHSSEQNSPLHHSSHCLHWVRLIVNTPRDEWRNHLAQLVLRHHTLHSAHNGHPLADRTYRPQPLGHSK